MVPLIVMTTISFHVRATVNRVVADEPPYEDEDLCQPWPSEEVATDLAYRQRKS